ncbi:MAG: glycosyltransferase family 2 protein [Solirubrobacterales bacterium]
MSTPSITVCIPTYNYAHYLGGAISSVLEQSWGDFELLVADDASSDNTAEVVQPFLADERVTFMPNEVNHGMFANFNRCVEIARGRYIKFLMADDWLAKDFLKEMAALLDEHPELALATSAGWLVDDKGTPFGEQHQHLGAGPVVPRSRVVDEFARGFNVIGMPTATLVRTQAMRDAGGFDAEYAPAADVNLWFKLLSTSDLGWIPRPLSYLRLHGGKTHEWSDGPNEIEFKVWREAAELPGSAVTPTVARRAARRWSIRYTVFAIKHALRGDFGTARKYFASVRENVGVIPALIAFVSSLPQVLRDRVVTTSAARGGYSIVLDPYPKRGVPIAELKADAEKGMRAGA